MLKHRHLSWSASGDGGKGFVEKCFLFFAVIELQGVGMGGEGHFLPGFAEGVDNLVFGGLGGKIGKLMFKKNKAKSVFQDATVGVVGKVFLKVQVLNAKDHFLKIPNLAKDFTGFLGVKAFKGGAPFQIAGAIQRLGRAGNLPAAKMLATGSETEFFGGVGSEFEHPLAKSLSLEQFTRMLNVLRPLDIWVGCVMLVEKGDGRWKAIRVTG